MKTFGEQLLEAIPEQAQRDRYTRLIEDCYKLLLPLKPWASMDDDMLLLREQAKRRNSYDGPPIEMADLLNFARAEVERREKEILSDIYMPLGGVIPDHVMPDCWANLERIILRTKV